MGGRNTKHCIPDDAYKQPKTYSTNTTKLNNNIHAQKVSPKTCNEFLRNAYTIPSAPQDLNEQRNSVPSMSYYSNKTEVHVVDTWTIIEKQKHESLNVPSVTPRKHSHLTKVAVPPGKFKSMENFLKHWPIWKEQFTSYINIVDEQKRKTHLWSSMLLNLMGTIKQEIFAELKVDSVKSMDNYLILITTLDAYHSFYTAEKRKEETIDVYVDKLKGMKLSNELIELDTSLKKKITKDIKKQCPDRFNALASCLKLDFTYSNIRQLTLKEIIHVWKMCEESTVNDENKNCNNCGKNHGINKCPAAGLECNKCKKRDHIASMCPLNYIIDCKFCGGCHKRNKCPAYGETCPKCHNLNHFSWKCRKVTCIKDCKFCALNHAPNRNSCPAKTAKCRICHTIGHYEVKCNARIL